MAAKAVVRPAREPVRLLVHPHVLVHLLMERHPSSEVLSATLWDGISENGRRLLAHVRPFQPPKQLLNQLLRVGPVVGFGLCIGGGGGLQWPNELGHQLQVASISW